MTVQWVCRHPASFKRTTDYVIGQERDFRMRCSMHRDDGACGTDGKYWEAYDDAPTLAAVQGFV